MQLMTMVSSRVEVDDDGENQTIVEHKRVQSIHTPEALDAYQKRIAAHDTSGERWRIFEAEITDDGEISVGAEVTDVA